MRFQSASDLAFALNLEWSSGTTAGVAATAPMEPRARRRFAIVAIGAGVLALGAAVGFFAHDRLAPGPGRITDVSYQQATFETGFVFAARFVDARQIVYSADWEGRSRDLFVTSLDTHESRPLGLAGADLLGVNPNGALAILSNSRVLPGQNLYVRGGMLAQTSLTGGAARSMEPDVIYADIAPDGEMAVVRASGIELLLEFPRGHVLSRGQGFLFTPRISPDGQHVAVMTSLPAAGHHLQIFRRGGALVVEDPVRLVDWWGLAWRARDEVWFAGIPEPGVPVDIYAFSLAGRRRLLYRAPGELTLHDVSPAGDVLATFDRGTNRLELIDGRGGSRDLTWQDESSLFDISNTGAVLMNQYGGGGGPAGAVMAWPPGASQPVKISDGQGIAISPDGTTALVWQDKKPPLWLVPVGAGQPRPLDLGAWELAGWAGWHPDGRLIMQVKGPDGARSTVAVTTSGGPPVKVLPDDLEFGGGRPISPDGTHIIGFARDRTLRLCALATGTCVALPGGRVEDQMCGWTADSREVIVRESGKVPVQLETVDIKTGRRVLSRVVPTKHPAVHGIRRVMVAPDGNLAINYSWARTDLFVIRGLR